MKIDQKAVVFPGQGSQKTGMGKDFYDADVIGKNTYHEASEALGWDVGRLCFETNERLNLTEYAQPCILATEIAMFRVIQDRYGLHPAYLGGHSLGEYTALVAGGVLPFAQALQIVQARGQLMQQATPIGMGGMAALIAEHIDVEKIEAAIEGLPVDIANINSKKQVVISGKISGLREAETRLTKVWKNGVPFRFVPLNVSAPFHSRFMDAIKAPFRNSLQNIETVITPDGASRVTANVTGGFHESNRKKIIDRLVSQLSGTVRWTDNMRALISRTPAIIEIGPGRPLRDFFKSIGASCTSITTFATAERTFKNNGNEQSM